MLALPWRTRTRLPAIPEVPGPRGTAGPVDPPAVDLLAPPPDPLALPPAPDPLAPPPPDPLAPPPPDPLAVPVAAGPVAGQDPTPFVGPPPFRPPTFNPVDGAMVGVAKPIVINFAVPIADRAMAESAIHISSIPPVPGKFYWMSPTQVRWRPFEFWPANTAVNIDAAGTKSSFRTGDSLVATADDATHQMTITRNGVVQKTFPMSMGMVSGGHQTPNGTYYVLEKFATVVMDSSTYGVPVNSAQGYKLTVSDAVGSTTAATSCTARRGRWQIRASATSPTAASTSARPTRSGSTTTSAAVTRSS